MKMVIHFRVVMTIVKLRFYSSFNALYRRNKSSHLELGSVELMKSKLLLAVTLYSLEVTEPQMPALAMMSNLINRTVHEIFKETDDE